jgi:hypothetical protein
MVFLLLGLAGAGVTLGLVPGAGLPRILVLLVFAVLALRWRPEKDREEVIREGMLLVFVLVLIKFLLLNGLAASDSGGAAGMLVRSVALGSLTQPPLPPGDEYRVFLVLLLFAGAVAARWEPLPEVQSLPERVALPRHEAEPLLLAGGTLTERKLLPEQQEEQSTVVANSVVLPASEGTPEEPSPGASFDPDKKSS